MGNNGIDVLLELDGISYLKNEPLSEHTTIHIGGNADLFIAPSCAEELIKAVTACRDCGVKYFLLGNGSDILFDDAGFRGAVISVAGLGRIAAEGETLQAECGVSFTYLAVFAAENSLTGLEFAYGIPGSVGGAVYMNAGAYGGEVSDVLESSEFFDPETSKVFTVGADGHLFGYRDSVLRHKHLIHLSSRFRLKKSDPRLIRRTMNDLMARRLEKQPLEFPSAGSVFKRPEGHFAGALIESSGLKGFSIGGAKVSEKHAGFIINAGNATCSDVLELIAHIQETVLKDHGVRLECEVVYVSP